jgi:hypothetical protein
MRVAARLLLAVLLAPAVAGAADVQVRPHGDLVDVVATAAPLADVLARLTQLTGMKVVYDGAPPRNVVTATLPQRTPVEAVLALFEGLGINYALKTDAGGVKVDTLIVTGASSGTTSARPAANAASSSNTAPPPPEPRRQPFQGRPQPGAEPDEPEEREEPAEVDEEGRQPERPPVQPPTTFNGPIPGPGKPGSPFGSGQIGPLTLPTPPAMAPQPGATPAPAPTPSPTPSEG